MRQRQAAMTRLVCKLASENDDKCEVENEGRSDFMVALLKLRHFKIANETAYATLQIETVCEFRLNPCQPANSGKPTSETQKPPRGRFDAFGSKMTAPVKDA